MLIAGARSATVRLHVRKMKCACGHIYQQSSKQGATATTASKVSPPASSFGGADSNSGNRSKAKKAAKQAGLAIQMTANTPAASSAGAGPDTDTDTSGGLESGGGTSTISSTAKKHKAVSGLLGMATGEAATGSSDGE